MPRPSPRLDQGKTLVCHLSCTLVLGFAALAGRAATEPPALASKLAEARAACEAGTAAACTTLGLAFFAGQEGLEKDQARAAQLYRRACDGGDSTGCGLLGVMFEGGMGGLAQDFVRAVELFQSSCKAGVALGCAHLGVHTEVGRPSLPRDVDAALELYRQSCDRGIGAACMRRIMLMQGEKRKLADGELPELLEKACNQGELRGCATLGFAYERGLEGLSPDAKRASGLYETACNGGAAAACFDLGRLYDSGETGVRRDPERAQTLFKQACGAGFKQACDRVIGGAASRP